MKDRKPYLQDNYDFAAQKLRVKRDVGIKAEAEGYRAFLQPPDFLAARFEQECEQLEQLIEDGRSNGINVRHINHDYCLAARDVALEHVAMIQAEKLTWSLAQATDARQGQIMVQPAPVAHGPAELHHTTGAA